jgi:signal transduction histidine kinase
MKRLKTACSNLTAGGSVFMNRTYFQSSKATVKRTFILCALLFCFMLLAGFHDSLHASKEGNANDVSIEEYKEIARTMVHGVAAGLGSVLANVKNEKDRIELIRSFIAPIRFYPDNSGYFYVYDFKCINIAHAAQKELQGKNLFDYKDEGGNYACRIMSNAAKNGGGFDEFYFAKPGSRGAFKKLGYSEPIPGTGYFIGTGVYLP